MIQISNQEALARLAEGSIIEVHFEQRPDSGATHAYHLEWLDVVLLLSVAPRVFETGSEGQALDFGIYVKFTHKEFGKGLLFIATNPECRLTEEQLEESSLRGHGEDIFYQLEKSMSYFSE